MRLIDVDNFLKQYSNQVPGDTIDAVDLRLALLKEPTVEVIPVEWLEKKIEKCKSSKDLYPQLFEEIMTIVIAEWRKENEAD